MSEMHLKQPASLVNKDLLILFVDHLLKTKIEFTSLKKQEIQDIFTKVN